MYFREQNLIENTYNLNYATYCICVCVKFIFFLNKKVVSSRKNDDKISQSIMELLIILLYYTYTQIYI